MGSQQIGVDIDLDNNQMINTRVENLSATPSFSASKVGRILYQTTLGMLQFDTGTAIKNVAEIPTGSANRVAYYNVSGVPSVDANFVWDATNKSLKLGGATTTSYLSAQQTDVSIAGVTTWININEDGRDAQKDAFVVTTTKTSATSGGTAMTMRSRGTGTTTFTMLNDGAEWFAVKLVDGVAGFSTASATISINKPFSPNADSTIDLGTTTRSWRTLFVGTGGGANGVINQLGNAVGSGTNFNVLLGNSRDDGLANKSAFILTGNIDYTTTHYLSVRGGVANTVLFTIAPLGRVGIGLGGTTALVTTPTAYLDIIGSTTANASLRVRGGVAPTTPNDADVWNLTTQKSFIFFTKGIAQFNSTTIHQQYNTTTVTGIVTNSSLYSSAGADFVGTRTLPATFWAVGTKIEGRISGTVDDGAGAFSFRILIGATVLATSPADIIPTDTGVCDYTLEYEIVCVTAGSLKVRARYTQVPSNTNFATPDCLAIPMTAVGTAPTGAIDVQITLAGLGNTITNSASTIKIFQ